MKKASNVQPTACKGLTYAQLINQDSGNSEYLSPIEIVNAAREVMGGIDFDPFSSDKANKRINAMFYSTKDLDAFNTNWHGRVWMNHPFGRSYNKLAIERLVNDYCERTIKQACCITYAATSEKWFQPLMEYPQCYLSPRTNYYLPNGTKKKGVTKGSVVTYLGKNVDKFIEVFDGHFGKVKI